MLKQLLAIACALLTVAGCAHSSRPTAPQAPAAARPCSTPAPLHMPLSTRSREAQLAFDNGLSYLHAYAWRQAAACLELALDLDPELAVAHIELARAFLGQEDPESARLHAAEAVSLAGGAWLTQRESAWIELGAQQVRASTAAAHLMPEQHAQYKRDIEAYISSFPEDPLGYVLRGSAESPRPDGRGQTGGAASIRWYQKALDIEPEHFAARHFLAHSYENIGRYEEAAENARRFAEAAPKIPHAQHMLAHVLPRLGGWEEALGLLERADALHRESFANGSAAAAEDWHFGHNLRLLAVVHWRLGHPEEAEELLRELSRVAYGGHRSGYYCLPLAQLLILRRRFSDALVHAESCLLKSSPMAQVAGEVTAGEAFLGLGQLAEAKSSYSRASQAFQELLGTIDTSTSESIFLFVSTLSLNTLDGKIALRDGRPDEGRAILLAIARRLVSGRNFDSWASGWMHLEGMVEDAQRAGYPETAQALSQQLRLLDPDYEIRGGAGDGSRSPAEGFELGAAEPAAGYNPPS